MNEYTCLIIVGIVQNLADFHDIGRLEQNRVGEGAMIMI